MKRTISIMLCLVMLVTLFTSAFSAAAAADINSVAITGYVAPVAGQKPSTNVIVSGTGYYIPTYGYPVRWKDNTADEYLDGSDTFIAGHNYQLEVHLKAENGYEFPSGSGNVPATRATVNGSAAKTSYPSGSYDGKTVNKDELLVVFGGAAAGTNIRSVEVYGIDAPAPGNAPDFSVDLGQGTYTLYHTDPITWTDKTTGKSMDRYDNNARFVEGRQYAVSIWLQAKTAEGHLFATTSNWGTAVSGTINDETAKVNKAYEQSPDEVIEISYTFTATAL